MLSLFFPNPDALRLALVSGIIPEGIAGREIAVAAGEAGGLWLETSAAPDKHSLAALAHIGVRPFSRPAELPSQTRPCWAAALPLKRTGAEPRDERVLFELPAARLAGFAAELARCDCSVESYRFAGGAALVRVARAPHYWVERARDGDAASMRCYREAAPDFWVESGWRHPLPPSLGTDGDRTILVSEGPGWRALDPAAWHAPREVLPLRHGPPCPCHSDGLPSVQIPIRLKRCAEPLPDETFWIGSGTLAALRPFFESADQRDLRDLSITRLRSTAGECIALRTRERAGGPRPVSGALRPFAAHPQLHRLAIPLGAEPTPALRPAALAAALGSDAAEMVWLEIIAGDVHRNRVAISAFRPLSEAIAHTAPQIVRHRSARIAEQPFALSGFVVIPEPAPLASPDRPPRSQPARAAARSPSGSARSRFAEWAAKLFTKSQDSGLTEAIPDDAADAGPSLAAPLRAVLTREERVARRTRLEAELFEREHAGPVGDRWAELAELYSEAGNSTDAALCWLRAVWNSPHPPDAWLRRWEKVEARTGKPTGDPSILRREIVRWIRLAHHPSGQQRRGEAAGALGRLEAAEANLPCRMVWLARTALARSSGGDVLLLARGRDRLFARLRREGALAALDTPSFLRFRGLAGSDRFPLARDWLVRCREPIHRWLKRQAKPGRLSWAGLDADIPCTVAYADLMLAWGFARLGERSRAAELTASAEVSLLAATGKPDAEVHRRLCALFRRETDTPTDSPDAAGRERSVDSPALADYSVAKLAAHSRILEAAAGGSEYGSGPLAALLGSDDLGGKLLALVEGRIPREDAADRPLLDLAGTDRTAATLPRVILAVLEVAEAPALLADALSAAPRALELLTEALRLRGIDGAESAAYSVRLSCRCVEILCRGSLALGDPAPLQSLVKTLARGLESDDAPTREILRSAAPRLFRALNRSGLSAEIRMLLGRWYTVGGERTDANLSAAIGWYALGEAERCNRILNDAREKLFVAGIADERERTSTALAYARALAHAPPRLALGRLEELFQRLGTVSTDGATARYFALKPLELIDEAITAIVNEDFGLGPEVRNWLDEDEQRIRIRITRDLDAALKGMD